MNAYVAPSARAQPRVRRGVYTDFSPASRTATAEMQSLVCRRHYYLRKCTVHLNMVVAMA